MTLEELVIRRSEILQTIGLVQEQWGDRSVQYGDATKALVIIDREIALLTTAATGSTSRGSMCNLAQYNG